MKLDTKNKKAIWELVTYVFFGVLTSAVSMITYFAVLLAGEYGMHIDPSEGRFYAIRVTAQILQWVLAVLFAFYTNKKWVFVSANKEVSTAKQLLTFSASRLLTLGFDTVITLGTVALLQASNYQGVEIDFLVKFTLNADVIAKIVASVVVVILNYVFSKLFVFRTAKENEKNEPSADTPSDAEQP